MVRVAGPPGADAGIDLLAEDRDGRLWAIQAECYDPGHTVSKRDLGTFLSKSSRPQFAGLVSRWRTRLPLVNDQQLAGDG